MQTSIITDFDSLANDWDDLLGRAHHAPFFMHYAYQRTWWQHLGQGDLQLLTVRSDEGQLVGLMPLSIQINAEGQRELSFVGCVDVSDYLDILIDSTHHDAVWSALIDALTVMEWSHLSLCSLPHQSPTLTQFVTLAQARGWQTAITQQEVCPVITLPNDWEAYLESLDKKQRHEIRRKIRKVEREVQSRYYVIDSLDGLDEAMITFIDLHQKSAPDKEHFWSEELILFFNALAHDAARGGWLKLYFIEVEGQAAGAMLCFDYQNEFLLYNSGYNPALSALSVGNVLTAYTIQEAIRLGRTRYDFLRGDEVYKFRFGAISEPVYDLKIERTAN